MFIKLSFNGLLIRHKNLVAVIKNVEQEHEESVIRAYFAK